MAETPLVQSLYRADRLLSAIAEAGPGGASLTDIARTAELNKSTAHHLLRTLIGLGFVEQSNTRGRYQIGLRPFQLIWQSQRLRELSGQYHQLLMRLCHRAGETVNLAIPYGEDALVVNSLEGRGIIRASTYTGALWTLHATACGKAILAHSDPCLQERIVTGPVKRFTPNTLTTPEKIQAEIVRIKANGYATEVEEHELGAACVGIPIFSTRGVLIGAVSIAAPASRMHRARLIELAEMMKEEIQCLATGLT